MRTYRAQGRLQRTQTVMAVSKKLSTAIYDHLSVYDVNELTYDVIEEIFHEEFEQYGIEQQLSLREEGFAEVILKILERQKGDEYKVSLEIVSRMFQSVFDSQMASLIHVDKNTMIKLQIKNQDLILRFEKNECVSLESDFNILHEAFL